MLSRLMSLANIGIKELPTMPEMIDETGKNKLCYNHVLGECPHGDRCSYKKIGGHVDGSKLQEIFVQKLCEMIKPGVEAAMYLNPGRPSPAGSSPSSKKRRQ